MPFYTENDAVVQNTAFQWKTPGETAHGMMFSILPSAESDSGLALTKRIEIVASVVNFVDLSELEIPATPEAAVDPKTGAMRGLLLSAPAIACLIASSLY